MANYISQAPLPAGLRLYSANGKYSGEIDPEGKEGRVKQRISMCSLEGSFQWVAQKNDEKEAEWRQEDQWG